nr:MAG TPA: hypothetical protein [Caudoviricetes sp.]
MIYRVSWVWPRVTTNHKWLMYNYIITSYGTSVNSLHSKTIKL